MNKCKFCGKPDDGVVCKACLSRGISKTGIGIKKVAKPILGVTVGAFSLFVASKLKD